MVLDYAGLAVGENESIFDGFAYAYIGLFECVVNCVLFEIIFGSLNEWVCEEMSKRGQNTWDVHLRFLGPPPDLE